ncbi:hypothetical protein K490DRAFT_55786 [Saccharata proteae CBS 121410]|uniref:Uncharacterized protein n=1 Tax=Saccharata proteae CBS 121410 TaxID=1314787 RepID=A0A6A5YBE6_9PEZI|nr:hypothetical protein K490DRAFT_55786 [Saccharata proteae CBS 121410]
MSEEVVQKRGRGRPRKVPAAAPETTLAAVERKVQAPVKNGRVSKKATATKKKVEEVEDGEEAVVEEKSTRKRKARVNKSDAPADEALAPPPLASPAPPQIIDITPQLEPRPATTTKTTTLSITKTEPRLAARVATPPASKILEKLVATDTKPFTQTKTPTKQLSSSASFTTNNYPPPTNIEDLLSAITPATIPKPQTAAKQPRPTMPPGRISAAGPRVEAWKEVQPLPARYRPAARRVTSALVALPIAIVTGWVLYDRLVLGKERKVMPEAPVGVVVAAQGEDGGLEGK